MKQHSGFTLIEIMVALAVFAILATITASVMYQAFDTRDRVNTKANILNEIQFALTVITHDTEQVIERAVHGNEARLFPPFIGQTSYLEFTRAGFVNPNSREHRSTLQRIAYLCIDHQFIRRTWNALDTIHRDEYLDHRLIKHLDECRFSYLSNSRQILQEWREYAIQPNQKKETLPIAIQITFTPHGMGNMSLLFPLPKALYANE
jgi:general secretion pathway protein J